MKSLSFSSRAVFIAAFALLVLAALGWGCWSLAAAQYQRKIDGWIDEDRTAGNRISFDKRKIFGFPRRITMRLVNLRWESADGIIFHTDAMDVSATPWNWGDFDVKFKNNGSVAAPIDSEGRALMLSSASGCAQVHLDSQGFWRKAKLSLTDSQIGLAPDYLFQAERLSASVSRPETPPKNHHEVGLTVAGEADNILLPKAMPSPFGDKAAKVSARMRVMGAVPDVRRSKAVDAWNKDSGIVEFDDFSVSWGVLDLTSQGTLGFDDDLQPEGAFAGTIAEPEKTMQALIDHGFIAMHDTSLLFSAMRLLAKPSPRGSKGMELPITIQLGGLFFGPIRIFTFPEIEWPVAPPVGK
ncbi:MAG: DUF2125 domain-containing protein [Alphaproteobacteria bacterium]|nr:DUF2125 domain-containing protein [Alphaproteobacteria bacterium]